MEKILLNDNWRMLVPEDWHVGVEGWLDTQVPGSACGTLLEHGAIPDPYYGENELVVLKALDADFTFEKDFCVTEEMLSADSVLLCFDGVDTLADIFLNGELIGQTYNMHRTWEIDIRELARVGENTLTVQFRSPIKYIKEENEKVYAGGVREAMEGYPHLRKAHCMFGWDWGPRLPDSGLFRDVYLKVANVALIDSVYITQEHVMLTPLVENPTKVIVQGERVTLDFDVDLEILREDEEVSVSVTAKSPDGQIYVQDEEGLITIEKPLLWWPRGYGDQPLYTVEVVCKDSAGNVLDIWKKRIGLRVMEMDTDTDQWGNRFAHKVNGVLVFAMGADYIPEDNLLFRVTPERTRKLLEDAAAANYNTIRVWGGGYYPDDYFFDICDELGLLVWQDLMFACSSYELNDEFEENITAEIMENVRRIRHHACLALWSGNNEMETQTLDKCWKPSQKQFFDYIKIFEHIIPKIMKQEDPNTFYWPSSPSSGGNFDNPWDENRGDAHYWDVWHGNKPFTDFRKYRFRYLSEFGFQAFPSLNTVETFTAPEDRNIFSRVMEMHQRNTAANGKILEYISATYLYPKDFDHLLYASQLLQAQAIRYGIEHFRRHRGRCMGTVVWQLNDIWPVASWSSIDYYGRWKALHYAEKRAFAPIMISCEEVGELSERPHPIAEPKQIEKSARLCVCNETMEMVQGQVMWSLRNPLGDVLLSGQQELMVLPLSSQWMEKLDFSDYDELGVYFCFAYVVNDEVVSEGTCLFTPPKHFMYENPQLELSVDGTEITVTARAYAGMVEIEGLDGDVRLSDNFFDMNPGSRTVTIVEGDATTFRVRSVYDIAH
ncbi:MAG: glycoside hydrolase family 2 protein [Lachnospiraceae bacterium]|nr:glycoside hydrolase family 2 protein [Lachnospiraceae bacterium]